MLRLWHVVLSTQLYMESLRQSSLLLLLLACELVPPSGTRARLEQSCAGVVRLTSRGLGHHAAASNLQCVATVARLEPCVVVVVAAAAVSIMQSLNIT